MRPSVKPVRKAVLPVAGLGTRLLPATKAVPKEMLPIIDKPALHYVVEEAREAGIEHLVLVTGRNKGAIEDYFDRAYELETSLRHSRKDNVLRQLTAELPIAGSISFVRQQSPLGLGHAIWCAREVIGDEAFAILLPDVLVKAEVGCLTQMMQTYEQVGGNIIAVDAVTPDQVSQYGIIAPKSKPHDKPLMEISGMIEKPAPDQAPSNLKITGRYIVQPELLTLLATQTAGTGGEIQLTDALCTLMQSQPFHACQYQGQDYDCGSKHGYFQAIMAYGLDHPEIGDEVRNILKSLKL